MVSALLRAIAVNVVCGCGLAAGGLLLAGPGVQLVAAEQEPGTVSIVVGGDVMLDGGPGHTITSGGDPLAELAEIFRGADIAVCNLECVVGTEGAQVLKPYTFRAPLASIPVLKRYFTAVNVANNHSGDFGKDGFVEELRLLDEAKLPYFGGGRDRQQAGQPLLLTRHGTRVALLGYNDFPPRAFAAGRDTPGVAWLKEKTVVAGIEAARRRAHADIVVPFLHWGTEITPAPTAEQRALARRLIDAGADAVVGAHPHVTQTVDIYHGRPIIYSLGNLVFDYFPNDPEVWTGWVVKLTFHKSGGVDLETFVCEIDAAGTPHLQPPKQRKP